LSANTGYKCGTTINITVVIVSTTVYGIALKLPPTNHTF